MFRSRKHIDSKSRYQPDGSKFRGKQEPGTKKIGRRWGGGGQKFKRLGKRGRSDEKLGGENSSIQERHSGEAGRKEREKKGIQKSMSPIVPTTMQNKSVTFLSHILDYVSCMNINRYKCSKSCSVLFRKFTSNEADNVLQLRIKGKISYKS